MNIRRAFIVGLGALLIAGLFSTGCGRGESPESIMAAKNTRNIEKLATLYWAFQQDNNWQGPADEAAFKSWIAKYPPRKLKRIEIDPDNTTEVFVNERDGEPFKIRYGVEGSMTGSNEPVIFESVGKDGKKLVRFLSNVEREVNDADYNELWERGFAFIREQPKN